MKYTYDDITFIIPVKIDTSTRLTNLYYSLMYLTDIHNFKIIIKEVDHEQKVKDINNIIQNPNIKYIFEQQTTDFFHRTKYLNDMIELCDTSIICNFDCDVLLPRVNIDKSLSLFENNMDVVYPYNCGFNLYLINKFNDISENINLLKEEYDLYMSYIKEHIKYGPTKEITLWNTLFGHAVMIKTESYKKGFGENELFKSYGPEDFERYLRFVKLKFNVAHLNFFSSSLLLDSNIPLTDQLIYNLRNMSTNDTCYFHMEHPRHSDSNDTNKYFIDNETLYKTLKFLSYDDYIKIYNTFDYVRERKYNQ
jgi:hypothetical protein